VPQLPVAIGVLNGDVSVYGPERGHGWRVLKKVGDWACAMGVPPDRLDPMAEELADASGGSVRGGAAKRETPGGKEDMEWRYSGVKRK
jgi:hypothetical protein